MPSRGSSTVLLYLTLVELVIGVTVIVVLANLMIGLGDAEPYWQRYYAHDVGSMLSSVHGVEGELSIFYDNIRDDVSLEYELYAGGLRVVDVDSSSGARNGIVVQYEIPQHATASIAPATVVDPPALLFVGSSGGLRISSGGGS